MDFKSLFDEKTREKIYRYTPEICSIAGFVFMLPIKKLSKQYSNNWLKMHGYPMRRRG